MKKRLIWALIMPFALSGLAQDNIPSTGTSSIQDRIESVQEVLSNIEGYVFLELGDGKERNLSDTFGRSNQVMGELNSDQLQALDWEVVNRDIVEISNEGKIRGLKYGETLMTVTDKNKEKHYFIVFVCPTVTILSPDGAIYTHQKIYNEQMKVDFSQSDNFVFNCVMAKYDGRVYDITDMINTDPNQGVVGRYISNDRIKSDVFYTITLEEEPDDILIGKSPIRLGVMNGIMRLMSADSAKPLTYDYLKNLQITASTMSVERNQIVEKQVFSSTGAKSIEFNGDDYVLNIPFNDGLYFIKLKDNKGNLYNYKVIIRYND